ncbi:MAG: hypothetical protein JWQ44_957 [Chthoniobacter sp.]|jgi:hypothetical protein|nr:hypothetical protein [Chthoniobacter sp.]
MSSSRKIIVLAIVLGTGVSLLAAKKDEQPKEPAKAEKKDKEKKKEDGKGKRAGSKEDEKFSLPIPEGHDSKGLKIPYRDADGNLQMTFDIGVARRTDPDHVMMSKLIIETFDKKGLKEMTIDLPNSVLDLNTRVITTADGVVIKRTDFELAGKTMEFNTATKQGRLGGSVHMKIYNLDDETNTPEEKPRAK